MKDKDKKGAEASGGEAVPGGEAGTGMGGGGSADSGAYTPASPVARIAAWVGIAYMLMLIGLNYYLLSTGSPIFGVAPLLLCPAAAGYGAVTVYRGYTGKIKLPVCVFVTLLCAAFIVAGIYLGVPALMGNFA